MLCGLILSAYTLSWNGFTLVEWQREVHSGHVLYHASTSNKVVALTFDDGPDPDYTLRILAILHQYKVKATFFAQASRVDAYPEIARQVVAEGHIIGNHTTTHPYLTRKSPGEVRAEMEGCEHSLAFNLHLKTHLFRPPRGDWNPTIFREARAEQSNIILWDVSVEHKYLHTPLAMAQRALHLIRPGSIVLMHDGVSISRESTVQALPLILDGLRARGYRIVTVPDLLHIPGNAPLPDNDETLDMVMGSIQEMKTSQHLPHSAP